MRIRCERVDFWQSEKRFRKVFDQLIKWQFYFEESCQLKILFLLFRMLIFWLATALLGTVWAQTPHPEVKNKSLKVVLGNTGRKDMFWCRPWYSCQWRLKISRSVRHGREISSLGRTAFPMMAVKSQTARSTLTQTITYPTTTSTHSVRTHFVGDEARS